VPLDLSRFSTALFSTGVAADGAVAFAVGAQPLTLAGLKRACMPVIGFYGGKDVLVPEATAEPLYRLLGDRYTHVVHPQAGHISYIFSTGQWRPGPKALDPNPIDVLLARVGC
jgi:pimeloyl-ACP methyl ester carboxylesterase